MANPVFVHSREPARLRGFRPLRFSPMVRLGLRVCFLLGLFLTGSPASGQILPLPQPEYITDRQGLPQAFVPSILQDRQGFIWVATRDGLCRYDGHRFKVFQPDPNGRPSLTFAGLEHLALDQRGRIWIVSERGDIDIFDPLTEKFVNFSRQPAFRQLTRGRQFRCALRFGRKNQLWIIPLTNGLIYWDLTAGKGQWYHHEAGRAGSLGSEAVKGAVEGADGRVWLATEDGLDQFDPATQQFAHYRHQPTNPRSLPDNQLTGMCARPAGEIVLLSRQHLSLFQPRTGQCRVYPLPAEAYQFHGTHIVTDRRGGIYFNKDAVVFQFTDQAGIRVAARGKKQPTDDCAGLFVDQTNVLWVGTAGAGIRTYDLQPNPFRTRRYEQNFNVDLLTSGMLGLPPISTLAAASLKDLSSYNFRSTFDATGHLWFNIGSSAIYRLDPTGKTDPVPLPYRDSRTMSCPLATDPEGHVWTVFNGTALRYDTATARWTRFPYSGLPQSISDNVEMVVDGQALWVANRVGGLWRVDRQTGRTRHFTNRPNDPTSISSNSLYCLSADPTDPDRLWIGTFGNGLCLFDKRTGTCRRFSQADGLPNNVIYSAIPDRQGNLWMGTNKGLCRMNRRTFATQTFTRDDGILADEFNSYHYLKFFGPVSRSDGTADERILMGGLEGFTVFDPARIRNDRFEPRVELTELIINNQPVRQEIQVSDGSQPRRSAVSPLGDRPIQATERLTLAYNQNYITVQFAALQFNRPAKNRYRYKLDGLEDRWKETDRPEAVYTNLPPGSYVLLLNGSNTSGIWSRHVRKLAITLTPPLWATWWAIGLYGLIGLGIGWALTLAWLNRLRLKQSVRLRQQEADQLRAVDTLKTTFFTNITHELRTPLTLIMAPAQQMLNEVRPDKDVSRLSTIDRQAHQLLRLINQWLDFSRLEAGALPVQVVRGDLGTLLSEWVGPFAFDAQGRDIELTESTALSGAYWFDADKLERIVLNLLSNALKFTPAGGRIRVALNPAPAGGVQLTVADTGIGMAAEALPRIFDRYYQADSSPVNQPVQPGSGIGLALVQELVALQGGTISVQSEPGQGTQFIVWLPYQPAGSVSPAQSPVPVVMPVHKAVTGDESAPEVHSADESPVVLIVEDNPELADFIAQSLPPGYQIYRAANGQEGLDRALTLLPDLVISDVLMPVLDGYGFCRQLKADIRTNHVPVILLTARSSLDSRLEGLSLGADDYLTKPFHVRELQLRVGNLLAQRRRLREHIRASLTTLDAPAGDAVPAPADPFITRLYTLIEAHLDQSAFGVEELAAEVGISRSYLFRKVKSLTGLSVNELQRNYRLQRATRLLQQGHGVAQTGYLVGFDTPAYFTQSFRRLYGITPTDYLRQGNPAQ